MIKETLSISFIVLKMLWPYLLPIFVVLLILAFVKRKILARNKKLQRKELVEDITKGIEQSKK